MSETDDVRAFDLMWECFPEPTLLVREDRTVVAANASARAWGRAEGGSDAHGPARQAGVALRDRAATSRFSLDLGAPVTGYWLPLPGSLDLYVHFAIGVADILQSQTGGDAANDRG